MSLGKYAGLSFCAVLSVVLSACSGGGSGTSNSIASVVQDLTLDPNGNTTVITFTSNDAIGGATVANFEADGGQTPVAVSAAGLEVTVEWDARVSPSDNVRAVGLGNAAFHAVETSDSSEPTFTITDGVQNPGLGDDVIELTFSGPRLIASEAEDPTNWQLTIDDTQLDLTGSTLALDVPTQVLTVTLGTTANLHASFEFAASGVHSVADVALDSAAVTGTASGDAIAPTLVAADQNLTEDEFGRVVDFTFDEAMDPVFATQLSHFVVPLPDIGIEITQPFENTLRVRFSSPIVPGVDTVFLSGVVDAHGNALPDVDQAITQPTPALNDFDGTPSANTVANAGGDTLTVVTTQAFDPGSAIDPASWTLDVAGTPVVLADQTFDYDLLTKTLVIGLDFDMQNGDVFTITGTGVLDVDGEAFVGVASGGAAGDATPPSVFAVVQNRDTDPTGQTLDVQLTEDVQTASAETLGNWSDTSTATLQSATLLSNLEVVRLVYDAPMVPGDVTLGTVGVVDLAGNAMPAAAGFAVVSTDVTAPNASIAAASAPAGASNDTLTVTFDDLLVEGEIETPANWTIESPIGTALASTGANVSWNAAANRATLTFTNGVNFTRGDDFSVSITGVRDVGGNTLVPATVSGDVSAETVPPSYDYAYRESGAADEVVIYFSEPCAETDDLYDATLNPTGTRYILRDSLGALRGLATGASVLDDGLGVRVSFGVVVAPTDTVDVFGVTDLVGNPLFPKLAATTAAEDTALPSLGVGLSSLTAVSGENNDTVAIVFDREMSPWGLLDPLNYTVVTPSLTTLPISGDQLSFDGNATVTLALRGLTSDIDTGASYSIQVEQVRSAQGSLRTNPDFEGGIAALGDAVAPNVLVGKVNIDPITANALLIEVNEAVSDASATIAANYDYNSGNLALSAQRIGPRSVRAVFGVTPTVGGTLELTLSDLANNSSGLLSRAVVAADAASPLVVTVAGVIMPGHGGDQVWIAFDEPVVSTSALVSGNYSVMSGSTSISLAGSRVQYESATNTVRIRLAAGQELRAAQPVTVTIANVRDMSGNTMPAPVQLNGSTSGDSVAPSFTNAMVNWRSDATGKVVDVLFSEDVDANFAAVPGNWTSSGVVSVLAVEMLERNHARLTLSAALAAGDTLGVTGVPDLAQNVSGAITIDPLE